MQEIEKKILEKAHDLVSAGWTKNYYAVDADGEVVDSENPTACRWCLLGSVGAAAARVSGALVMTYDEMLPHREAVIDMLVARIKAMDFELDEPSDHPVVGFNDSSKTTHADVLGLLDEVLANSP